MTDDSLQPNNFLPTAKSREVQRAMLAEMRGERSDSALHFMAAAYMELVLATEYDRAGNKDLSLRSRVSAASCLWRAGQVSQASQQLDALTKAYPDQAPEIQKVRAELAQDYPALAS